MHFRPVAIAVALAAGLTSLAAQAASWQPVVAANGDRVEIDQGRILRVGHGQVVAWTRLIPNGELRDGEGTVYSAIQAMNRYDCEGRRFATLKRVYMVGGRALREEKVASPKDMDIAAGSYDEKLLKAACGTGGADASAEAAPAMESRPGVMHADMRSVADAARARTLPVADTKPAAKAAEKPVDKAAGKAEAKPADKPVEKAAEGSAEKPTPVRPRFIDLPKIDKSQLEDPNPPPAKPAEAKPEAKPEPKTAAARAAAAKAAEARVSDAKSVAKSVERTMDKPAEKPAVSRYDLERQYATSGPRRAAPVVRKKPEAESAVEEHKHIHWSYEGEGAPANWGKLKAEYGTCATGKRQSPIDIREGIIKVDLEPIKFDYKHTQFRVVDNGHTIQVTVGEGSTIHVMGRSYELVQFHFHKPSEERVNGRAFDMVAHLVHKDLDGNLAVIAVLLERGAEHALVQTIWNHMPLEADMAVEPPGLAIDLNRLLPESRSYYTYMGSLTTPPCTEGVLWMVMKQPMQVSSEQIAIFSRLYRHNARPVQPGNNRLIKESR